MDSLTRAAFFATSVDGADWQYRVESDASDVVSLSCGVPAELRWQPMGVGGFAFVPLGSGAELQEV